MDSLFASSYVCTHEHKVVGCSGTNAVASDPWLRRYFISRNRYVLLSYICKTVRLKRGLDKKGRVFFPLLVRVVTWFVYLSLATHK